MWEMAAQFGLAGVSLGMMYKLSVEHIGENTEATKKMAEEMKKLRQDMMHQQLVSAGEIAPKTNSTGTGKEEAE